MQVALWPDAIQLAFDMYARQTQVDGPHACDHIDVGSMRNLQLLLSKVGPLEGSHRVETLEPGILRAAFGFSANPCLVRTAHVRALFEWKTGTRVDGDPRAAVAVLLNMREAARGLRRSEQYLEVLWMKRS